MKKVTETKKRDYIYVEKNIYKTGTRYRVRVAGISVYEKTLNKARKLRKELKNNLKASISSGRIW
jgi:hypothetical protein